MRIDREQVDGLMRQRGITHYKDLAAAAGITGPLLARILARGSCTPRTATKIAKVLGVYAPALGAFQEHAVSITPPYDMPTLEQCQQAYEADAKAQEARKPIEERTLPHPGQAEELVEIDPFQRITVFLERPVPDGWNRWSLQRRLMFWREGIGSTGELAPRSRVCVLELWVEAMGRPMRAYTYHSARNISAFMDGQKGWKKAEKPLRFGPYGKQRGWERVV